jgi:hypothetical protein
MKEPCMAADTPDAATYEIVYADEVRPGDVISPIPPPFLPEHERPWCRVIRTRQWFDKTGSAVISGTSSDTVSIIAELPDGTPIEHRDAATAVLRRRTGSAA